MRKVLIKILTIILTLISVLCFATGCSLFETGTKGLKYMLINNDTEYEISEYTGSSENVIIPSMHNGKPVTSIGECAFRPNLVEGYYIKSVKIPASIKNIGALAFCHNALSKVTFEKGSKLETIGISAFSGCEALKEIKIPASVTNIGEGAFSACYSLEKVSFERNSKLNYIGDRAFSSCQCLEELQLPDEVQTIGEEAFSNCRSLATIELPNSIVTIGSSAFYGCRLLRIVTIGENIKNLGNGVFVGNEIIIKCESAEMPSGWDIEWNSLASVIWDCKNNELTTDGYIYVEKGGIRYFLKDGEATVINQFVTIKTANIPSKLTHKGNDYIVTNIVDGAFLDCTLLTSVTIPETVTTMGFFPFHGCVNLKIIFCKAKAQPSGFSPLWNQVLDKYQRESREVLVIWGWIL